MCQSINHIVSETLVFEDWRKKLKSIQQQNNKVPTSVAAFFLISFLNRSFDPSSRISRYKQTISYLLLNQTQKGPCPFISLLIRIVHHHHLLSSSIIVVIYLNQFCSLSFFLELILDLSDVQNVFQLFLISSPSIGFYFLHWILFWNRFCFSISLCNFFLVSHSNFKSINKSEIVKHFSFFYLFDFENLDCPNDWVQLFVILLA